MAASPSDAESTAKPPAPSAEVKDKQQPSVADETENDAGATETEKEQPAKQEKKSDDNQTTQSSGNDDEPDNKQDEQDDPQESEDAAPEKPKQTTNIVTTPKDKKKASRKSGGAVASSAKKLNRKGSKRTLTNLDAQPGDHYLVKLKGYPPWPAIICDESMLPNSLIKTRPVTAARPDGTYADAYAYGGKRVADRNFPVMYLSTNEFGWVLNTNLLELSPEKASEQIKDSMRKDLKEAFELAAEDNDLDYYKDMLKAFQEELLAQEKAAATPKKSKKAKVTVEDEDVEMEDVDDTKLGSKPKATKSKKRKAEDDEPSTLLQKADSAKKPKIKLTTSSTPKATNGTPAAKATKEEPAKTSKPKAKKPTKEGDKKDGKDGASKDPELSASELLEKKKLEVLYLRHRLQRGLLMRDQEPKEEEMTTMSHYLSKLEGFPALEVEVIRETKINKVLKAILKLLIIPKDEEFKFKHRSQTLLDKWNKILVTDTAPAAAAAPSATANGVSGNDNGDGNAEIAKEEKENKETTNGVAGKSTDEQPKKTDDAEAPEPTVEKSNKGDGGKSDKPEKSSAKTVVETVESPA